MPVEGIVLFFMFVILFLKQNMEGVSFILFKFSHIGGKV